jgi:N-acetylglucosaminylphosphatidylinositol deacetylase
MLENWIFGSVIGITMMWILAWNLYRQPIHEFKDQTVLILTAHPDDECMFFSPTIQALNSVANVHVLCLSQGSLV